MNNNIRKPSACPRNCPVCRKCIDKRPRHNVIFANFVVFKKRKLMHMNHHNVYLSITLSAIITLIIRNTVYTDDCNLFITSMTFLFFLCLTYITCILIQKLLKRHSK